MNTRFLKVKYSVILSLLQGFRFADISEIEEFKQELMNFYSIPYQSFSEMRKYVQELISPDMDIPDILINEIQDSSEHVMSYIISQEDLQKEFVICL